MAKWHVVSGATLVVVMCALVAGQPPDGRQGGRRGGFPGPGGAGSTNQLAAAPVGKSEAEKRVLAVLDDMDRSQRQGHEPNVQREEGRLLRLLAETNGSKHVVELGTANGYSTIWLCLGVQAVGGKVTTFEWDSRIAAVARENFKRAGVEKIATVVEGDAHEQAPKLTEPIDLLFIDADKSGYADYVTTLLPRVRPGGLIVAHDINAGMVDQRFLEAITANPDLDSVLLNTYWGMSVTLKKR
jgi:caffeoyl-CoA O-methyltransferase